MSIVEPSILPGFMELLPEDQVLFDAMKATIEKNFIRYGFWPLDTPMIEKDEILLAKGGGETSKQIYSIARGEGSKAQSLRFDLTVPLARYVAQRASDLKFPFRRYQIGKVFRGERNQKGRYREFYQADVDIIGQERLDVLNDAEIPALIYQIFQDLAIPGVRIHINHRALLQGFFLSLGLSNMEEILRLVDKIRKLPEEVFRQELGKLGLDKNLQEDLLLFLGEGSKLSAFDRIQAYADSLEAEDPGYALFLQGAQELKTVYQAMVHFGLPQEAIVCDLSISRGLDYYTGMVYETFVDGYEDLGSIASGGRYENLASNFTKQKLPGVGMSIGLTRLFYQLKEAGLLQEKKGAYLTSLVLPMGEGEREAAMDLVHQIRQAGLSAQIYLEKGKMKKKFSYADSLGVRYVFILGQEEVASGQVSLKDMETGDQVLLPGQEAIQRILQAKAQA